MQARDSAVRPSGEETTTALYGCTLNPVGVVARHTDKAERTADTVAGSGLPAVGIPGGRVE
eukprot:CAMPEP_0194280750 /NCGR_PEP_ID=MMETSP0169-20130528/18612_1 /TAXON_ID=218684 /ORGANISM="Corethron pennatum, Strain L29A3" /LENGTH=60 /DNA_ID=CAMNT_0039025599 /DNA_START=508 /DNA_END=690 /DNA_ORIENTATION=+